MQFHEDKQTPRSARQFVKTFHFEEFDKKKTLTSSLKIMYVDVLNSYLASLHPL